MQEKALKPTDEQADKVKILGWFFSTFEIFVICLVALSTMPTLTDWAIKLFTATAPKFGMEVLNCSETDFWLNGLYGVLISTVVFCLLPSNSLFAIGITRAIRKQKHGILCVTLGLLFTALNITVGLNTLTWFDNTSREGILTRAEAAMSKASKAQDRYKEINKKYAGSMNGLGDFNFAEVGTIEVTLTPTCLKMKATHSCLVVLVKYDSCNGGILPVKNIPVRL